MKQETKELKQINKALLKPLKKSLKLFEVVQRQLREEDGPLITEIKQAIAMAEPKER